MRGLSMRPPLAIILVLLGLLSAGPVLSETYLPASCFAMPTPESQELQTDEILRVLPYDYSGYRRRFKSVGDLGWDILFNFTSKCNFTIDNLGIYSGKKKCRVTGTLTANNQTSSPWRPTTWTCDSNGGCWENMNLGGKPISSSADWTSLRFTVAKWDDEDCKLGYIRRWIPGYGYRIHLLVRLDVKDIDECTAGTHGCGLTNICRNSFGTYQCLGTSTTHLPVVTTSSASTSTRHTMSTKANRPPSTALSPTTRTSIPTFNAPTTSSSDARQPTTTTLSPSQHASTLHPNTSLQSMTTSTTYSINGSFASVIPSQSPRASFSQTGTTPTPTQFRSATTTPRNSMNQQRKGASLPVPLIAGAAGGGFLLVVAVIVVTILVRRPGMLKSWKEESQRRRQRKKSTPLENEVDNAGSAESNICSHLSRNTTSSDNTYEVCAPMPMASLRRSSSQCTANTEVDDTETYSMVTSYPLGTCMPSTAGSHSDSVLDDMAAAVWSEEQTVDDGGLYELVGAAAAPASTARGHNKPAKSLATMDFVRENVSGKNEHHAVDPGASYLEDEYDNTPILQSLPLELEQETYENADDLLALTSSHIHPQADDDIMEIYDNPSKVEI